MATRAAAATTRRRARRGVFSSPLAGLALVLSLALGLAGSVAGAGPLDLDDPAPRPIEVRFEISPADQPGRLDSNWSPPRRALLEPAPDGRPDQVRIRIPAREMEAHLRSTGTAVVAGSFSDFLWTLDRQSGHVVAAHLRGQVEERVGLGLLSARVAVAIEVEMSTARAAGFRTDQKSFGKQTHDLCLPTERSCIAVEGLRYDPSRGYVNAVGALRAFTPVFEVEAFSPLGEARFSEHAEQALGRTGTPTSEREEVFSSQTTRGPADRAEDGHDEKAERPSVGRAARPG